ncbi:hypothetical protein B0A52_07265 [Exophiala mesophila]|uniref:Uncharacterized protein n=1 Tax=Exophiala mesophila TaxID=212818 RepID=A0A438MX24_EXOME|nr:hypothetical protein B0A52_07265 [Exophiala mesophila]
MTTPQQHLPKNPRRSGKKHRQQDDQDQNTSTTGNGHPKSSPYAVTNINGTKSNHNSQPRRPSHAQSKHPNDGYISDISRHNQASLDKTKATPVKPAAYAGSTFQQSPAASALPLPSFYSKSLPNNSVEQSSKAPSPPAPNSGSPAGDSPSKRESTPLDFLFEAARKAKATPRGESPATQSRNPSAALESPYSRSPAPREGESMFPFELEGATTPGEDGSAFATPYKDRIAAYRSTKSTANGAVSNMDENERREKSEALKKLLMNSGSSATGDMGNPFNARPPHQPHDFVSHGPPQGAPPVRPSSNPSASFYTHDQRDYHAPPGFPQMPYHYPPASAHTPKRPPSSNLRNVYHSEPEYAELSSDNAITPPISTARRHGSHMQQHPDPRYGIAPTSPPYAPQPQMPMHQSKPSAQQLEDDLRRVLKLDLTSRG